jgi:hypothetical protein
MVDDGTTLICGVEIVKYKQMKKEPAWLLLLGYNIVLYCEFCLFLRSRFLRNATLLRSSMSEGAPCLVRCFGSFFLSHWHHTYSINTMSMLIMWSFWGFTR